MKPGEEATVTGGGNGSEKRLVAGRYRLVEKLGAGAYGTVWRAVDNLLEVQVAVKQLRLDPTADDESRRRALSLIEREARIVAKLRDHPHVVTVLDVVADDGLPWIVMELVESQSLSALVRAGGPLPPERVAAIGAALLTALVAAHELGITHRDVKPANVLVGAEGRAVLADFGVASHDGHSTIAAGPVGTLAYMAPEQFAGVHGNPAGDLFSLGATLYFALTGRAPFARPTDVETIYAVIHHDPPRPAGPDLLVDTVLALMTKEPAERLTASEAADVFAAAASGRAPRRGPVPAAVSAGSARAGAALLADADGPVDSTAGRWHELDETPAEQAGTRTGPSAEPTLAGWTPAIGRQRIGPASRVRERAVGIVLLAFAAALTLAPWLAVSLTAPPWWAYSAATVSTVFFGAWAAAFSFVLFRR
jgi:serine/threonine protein kinase